MCAYEREQKRRPQEDRDRDSSDVVTGILTGTGRWKRKEGFLPS